MSTRPLVSVIIIFLNAERFLEEAVASVFAQSYPDWELWLCDDGSTDGSTAIARRLAAEQPERVRYLEHPYHENRGMSATRNLGIGQARGEYLAFLDADDVWLPEKLAQQVALLDAHPNVAMVYGPTEWWYSWTGELHDLDRDFVHELGVPSNTLLKPPELLARFLRHEGYSPCTCSMLVRQEVVRQVGGFEESFRGLYEDQAFCAKLCLRWPVMASGECLYRYRQHPDSACAVAAQTNQAAPARRAFLTWLQVYLNSSQIAAPELQQALLKELNGRNRARWRSTMTRARQAARQVRGRVR